MDWETLISANGVRATAQTPLFGGPQKAGLSITIGKLFGEVSIGGVEYRGLSWTYTETSSNTVVFTGVDEITETGVYLEFKNDTGETIRNPDGTFKNTSRFGAVVEVGVVSNGTTIDDAAGITVGAGGQIALGRNGIGYSQEEDINSLLITHTVTLGPGGANVGLVVTQANVFEIARSSVARDVTPFIVIDDPEFDTNQSIGSNQYFILNAFDDTGGYFNEVAFFLTGVGPFNDSPNTAVAFEQNGVPIFYVRKGNGDEYFYDPATSQYTEINTGIGYLGINVSPTEMANIHSAMIAAAATFSNSPVNIVTPSPRVDNCFFAGTMIDMADGSRKPIEDIRPEDQVMAFDGDGKKVAGRVTRTMTNESKIILDFHGTFVTPGHVYYCAGGKFEGGFAPIIDILRDDGVVQHEDNTLIRAATGCVVGSELDAEIWVLGIEADANGVYHEKIRKKLRLGTRFIIPDGSSVSIAEDLQKIGMRACADGFVEHIVTGQRALYQWPVGGQMPPNPEDYVLQRSGTTLEDIYRAGEWEGQRPQMPPPMIRDGGAVTPVSERTLMAMPRNVPMAMREGTPPDASPKLNRKARKAMEAKRRKAAKQTRGSQTLH